MLNLTELEALVLNSDGPEFEAIRDTNSKLEAYGIIAALLEKEGEQASAGNIWRLVDRIQEAD